MKQAKPVDFVVDRSYLKREASRAARSFISPISAVAAAMMREYRGPDALKVSKQSHKDAA